MAYVLARAHNRYVLARAHKNGRLAARSYARLVLVLARYYSYVCMCLPTYLGCEQLQSSG